MFYTVNLSEEEFALLQKIVGKIDPKIRNEVNAPIPKKKTKTEIGLERLREYRNKKRKF